MCWVSSSKGFRGVGKPGHPQGSAGLSPHRLHASHPAESVGGCLQAHMLSDLLRHWRISPAWHCLGFEPGSRYCDLSLLCICPNWSISLN